MKLQLFFGYNLFVTLFVGFDIAALVFGAPDDAFLLFSGIWGVVCHTLIGGTLAFGACRWACDVSSRVLINSGNIKRGCAAPMWAGLPASCTILAASWSLPMAPIRFPTASTAILPLCRLCKMPCAAGRRYLGHHVALAHVLLQVLQVNAISMAAIPTIVCLAKLVLESFAVPRAVVFQSTRHGASRREGWCCYRLAFFYNSARRASCCSKKAETRGARCGSCARPVPRPSSGSAMRSKCGIAVMMRSTALVMASQCSWKLASL